MTGEAMSQDEKPFLMFVGGPLDGWGMRGWEESILHLVQGRYVLGEDSTLVFEPVSAEPREKRAS
jgi:hypothetical protein